MLKPSRTWLPLLAALALTAPLAAQELHAPEPRWHSTSDEEMAQATAPGSSLATPPSAMKDAVALESDAAQTNTPPADQAKKKKMFGACAPSFTVVNPGQSTAPLSVHDKFRIFYRYSYDPCRIATVAFSAGISQAEDEFHDYGQGAQGYGKRFGANLADTNLATFFGRFLLPSLLHDDPRYFRVGQSGTFKQRLLHALVAPEWTRRDNGTSRFNYSRVIGDFMATSVGNAYYPDRDRGADHTFARGGSMLAGASGSAVFEEFWPDIKARLFKKHKASPAKEAPDQSATPE